LSRGRRSCFLAEVRLSLPSHTHDFLLNAASCNVISFFSKYQKEELKPIMNCTKLVYYDPYFAAEIYSNQKKHNTSLEAEPV
jgi:16S rRNA G966 N2-methylase RsmD